MLVMLVGLLAPAWAAVPALMTVESGTAPDGVSTRWTLEGCNVRVRVENATPVPVEVDWNRSVYAPEGAAAVGLVPGSASKQSSMLGMSPMVVPPGAFAEEVLFRKDRLPADGDGCLIDPVGKATVTLSVSGGWATQALTFQPDVVAIEALRKAMLRLRPVLNFRLGRVCIEHERRLDDDPCLPNNSRTSAKAAADEIGERMRAFGCGEESIQLVADAVVAGATSADRASDAYRKCVLGKL